MIGKHPIEAGQDLYDSDIQLELIVWHDRRNAYVVDLGKALSNLSIIRKCQAEPESGFASPRYPDARDRYGVTRSVRFEKWTIGRTDIDQCQPVSGAHFDGSSRV
ncbi:MAG: hypothetical protein D6781_00480 [Verrucomicrobia bacterium]|nr:MAG: hypothetical protein D6781_00480 [Verrucomicrobiota bacterium]